MTIRFDVCLVVSAVIATITGHFLVAVVCLGVLWLHKYG